jgi:hypothetical protein
MRILEHNSVQVGGNVNSHKQAHVETSSAATRYSHVVHTQRNRKGTKSVKELTEDIRHNMRNAVDTIFVYVHITYYNKNVQFYCIHAK